MSQAFLRLKRTLKMSGESMQMEIEAARALKEHGFRDHGFRRLISIIHPDNIASIRVAEKNGMQYEREVEFEGRCLLYTVSREENDEDESEQRTPTA
jgi:hypothetical protein